MARFGRPSFFPFDGRVGSDWLALVERVCLVATGIKSALNILDCVRADRVEVLNSRNIRQIKHIV